MLCPNCHAELTGIAITHGVCLHHVTTDSEWSDANRRACDLFHRGIESEINVPIEDIFVEVEA